MKDSWNPTSTSTRASYLAHFKLRCNRNRRRSYHKVSQTSASSFFPLDLITAGNSEKHLNGKSLTRLKSSDHWCKSHLCNKKVSIERRVCGASRILSISKEAQDLQNTSYTFPKTGEELGGPNSQLRKELKKKIPYGDVPVSCVQQLPKHSHNLTQVHSLCSSCGCLP